MIRNSASTACSSSTSQKISVFRKNENIREERELSLLIPTYNEADNIEALIQRILGVFQKYGINGEVLIVDDNSPDGTGEIVKRYAQKFDNVTLVLRSNKDGYGNAWRDGVRFTSGKFIMGMDADFSHNPEQILSIYNTVKNCDIVIGSRYVTGGRITGWGFSRRLVSKAANLLVNIFFRLGVHDNTSGFRAYKRGPLIKILPYVNCFGYDFLVELLIRSRQFNLTVKEVPITFKDRSKGVSKLSTRQYRLFIRLLFNELKMLSKIREDRRTNV